MQIIDPKKHTRTQVLPQHKQLEDYTYISFYLTHLVLATLINLHCIRVEVAYRQQIEGEYTINGTI